MITLTLPVGRLVQGSLYEPQTKDFLGNPLTIKAGPNAGEATERYYFGYAIKKKTEKHWNQTEWGAEIYKTAQEDFPQGQWNTSKFAWKIIDGDSTEQSTKGYRWCDKQGYAGHWILNISSAFPVSIWNETADYQLNEKDLIQPGDYIEACIVVKGNGSMNVNSGIYLNHKAVCFIGHGERIVLVSDPKTLGLGKAKMPTDAFLPNKTDETITHAQSVEKMDLMPKREVVPHETILMPPKPTSPPKAPQQQLHRMTEKAKGYSYEDMIANGWSDTQLIEHGMMEVG
jgi:hypothetical protein